MRYGGRRLGVAVINVHHKVEVASEGNGNEDRVKSGVLGGGSAGAAGVRVRIDDTLHV